MRFFLKEMVRFLITWVCLFFLFTSVVFVALQQYATGGKEVLYDLVNGYFLSVLVIIVFGSVGVYFLNLKGKVSNYRAGAWLRTSLYTLVYLIGLGFLVSQYVIK